MTQPRPFYSSRLAKRECTAADLRLANLRRVMRRRWALLWGGLGLLGALAGMALWVCFGVRLLHFLTTP